MFDFERLDKLIHEKGRLAIMTLLAARPSWPFQDLKAELKMSDGNLVSHLRTLHQAGYVAYRKEILDRPQTAAEE
ncbi:MAG: transcriptional regulator, partial [Bryobacteraceae bacterium]